MLDQLTLGLAARDRSAARNVDLITRLIPLARELAHRAGASGITVSDLRLLADQRGLLPPSEGRRLSWLGAVPLHAGLVAVGWRRSVMAKSHANLNRVWTLP